MRKRNTYIYYITQVFHSLMFTIPIWIVYYLGFLSAAQLSVLVTVQYIFQMVMELPSGALADLLGRRSANLLGFFIGAVSFLLFPLASQFWHFLLLSLLLGTSDSFRSGSEEALIYDTFKQTNSESKLPKVYANGNTFYQAGLIIGAVSGGFIYQIHHALPYILYGLSLLIGTFFAGLYIEPKIDSEQFSLKNYFLQIKEGSKEAFKSKYSTYLSLFYIFVGGISWSSTLYFNAVMLVELGFSDSTRGILSAGMRLLNVILISSLLSNEKIFSFKRTIWFFPLVMAFAYLPGVLLEGYWGVPFVQAAMIATTARWVILSPLTNGIFSPKYRATAISLLSLMIGFVYVGLTGISSFILEYWNVKVMFSLMGVLSLVTTVPLALKLLQYKDEKVKVDLAEVEALATVQVKDDLDPV